MNVLAKVRNLVLWLAPTFLRVRTLAGLEASSLVLGKLELLAWHGEVADRLHCFVMAMLADVWLLCSAFAFVLGSFRCREVLRASCVKVGSIGWLSFLLKRFSVFKVLLSVRARVLIRR